ncbi:MAG TPA: hypothetical protein VL588_01380 [Bdellovibrionota bacterium]|nr:hypothetical protein [Bdellovibrionota bacterium]
MKPKAGLAVLAAGLALSLSPRARAEDAPPAAAAEAAPTEAAAEANGVAPDTQDDTDDAQGDAEGVEILDGSSMENQAPAPVPVDRHATRLIHDRQIEGTTAKRQLDQGNIVIKSPYQISGRSLEVDPD